MFGKIVIRRLRRPRYVRRKSPWDPSPPETAGLVAHRVKFLDRRKSPKTVRAEYKVKCIANRDLTNVVSADQKRVAVERQISALDASEVFDFELQDAHRLIWLA